MNPKDLACDFAPALTRCRFCRVGIDAGKRFCEKCGDNDQEAFKAGNRARKAVSIAGVLRAHGFTASQVSGFTDETWAMAETLAKVTPASRATRAITVVFMASQEV